MEDDRLIVFVSSTTGPAHIESLDQERDTARQTILELPLTRPWVWEDGSAATPPPPEIYLPAVKHSDIFILLLGKDVTPAVVDEYDTASTDPQKPILVFVKIDSRTQAPESRMSTAAKEFLYRKIRPAHRFKTFVDLEDLRRELIRALCNELTKASRGFWGTPASRKQIEGADETILMIGAGELGLEIARSLRRYSGNRVVLHGVDRYSTPPARDELHNLVVLSDLPWQEDQLINAIRQQKPRPTKILPELMATPPGLFHRLEAEGYIIIPNADTLERLVNRINYRTELDKFLGKRIDVTQQLHNLGLKLARWQPVTNEADVDRALSDFNGSLFLKPSITDLGLGQSLIADAPHRNRKELVYDAWNALMSARYGGQQGALVEEYVDFDSEIYQVVVRSNGQDFSLNPVEYSRKASLRDELGGPWQLDYGVQPPILRGVRNEEAVSILENIRMASLLLLREWLDTDGLFGFEYFVKGNDIWLNKITFRPDINGIVTVFSSRPSIFDVYAKMILGQNLPIKERTTPAACCPKLWPDRAGAGAQVRFVISNAQEIRGEDVDVFPIDKHETYPRDRVAFVVAWAGTSPEALALAETKRDEAIAINQRIR